MPKRKLELRNHLLATRRSYVQDLTEKQRQEAALNLSDNAQQLLTNKKRRIVTGFWPLWDEIDCKPLLQALGKVHTIGLPVVKSNTNMLEFRLWTPESELVSGTFNISIPKTDVVLEAPDIVLVPGVAFDLEGHRLGYGRGYYDQSIKALRQKKKVFAIGLGYDKQVEEKLPIESFDEPMDAIVTNKRIILRNQECD